MKILLGICFFLMHHAVFAEWDGHGYYSDGGRGLSFFILFLGALHAIPVLIAAMKTQSKVITLLVALGSAIFAVMVGGDAYAVTDLLFVGIGTYAAFKIHLDGDGLSSESLQGGIERFQREEALRLQQSELKADSLSSMSDDELLAKVAADYREDEELMSSAERANLNCETPLVDEVCQTIENSYVVFRRQRDRRFSPIHIEAARREITRLPMEMSIDEDYLRERFMRWKRSQGEVDPEVTYDEINKLMWDTGMNK
jgi:hypothetical protein